MKFTKRLFFSIIMAISFCLTACQSRPTQASKPYELAIFDDKIIRTFNLKDSKLEPLETIKRKGTKAFWAESFADAGSAYVTRTVEGDGLNIFVESIDKKTLAETIEPAQGNDAYTSVTDGQFFYATAVFTDRIDFYKYNLDMKPVHKVSIPNGDTINASNQFVVDGDNLYLLVSQVIKETGQAQTVIWKMDKAFHILDTINLEENSVYLRMSLVGRKLYLSATFNGIDANGENLSGDHILVYDLDTSNKSYLPITTPFPQNNYYDKKRNLLVIKHDGFRNQDFPWTILSLDSGQETKISFPEFSSESYLPPFFAMTEDSYYFLFKDKLVRYQPDSHERQVLDLSVYNINNAHALISNE